MSLFDLPEINTSQHEVDKKFSISNVRDGINRGSFLPLHAFAFSGMTAMAGGIAGIFAGGTLGSLFNLISNEPGFKLIETFANYGGGTGAVFGGAVGAGMSVLMQKDQLSRGVPNGRIMNPPFSKPVPLSEDSPSYKAGIVAGVSLTLAIAAGAGKALYEELKIDSAPMPESQVEDVYESSSSAIPENIQFDEANGNYIIPAAPSPTLITA